MRARILWAAVVLAFVVAPAEAQLASPNKAGVSMGHLHYQVRDVEANKRFWMALGGTPIAHADAVVVKFPDVLVFLTQGDSTGGTDGSVVNHVAFRVQSFSTVEAAGLKVTRLANFPGVGSTNTPEGERIELFENAALNLTFTQDAVSGRDRRAAQSAAADSDRVSSRPPLPAGRKGRGGQGVVCEDVRRRSGQTLELRRRRFARHQPEFQ